MVHGLYSVAPETGGAVANLNGVTDSILDLFNLKDGPENFAVIARTPRVTSHRERDKRNGDAARGTEHDGAGRRQHERRR